MGDLDINGDGYADEVEVYELADGGVAATVDLDGGGVDLILYDADNDGILDQAWAVQDVDGDGDFDRVEELPLGHGPGNDLGGDPGYGAGGGGSFSHSDATDTTVSTSGDGGEGYIAFDDGSSYSWG